MDMNTVLCDAPERFESTTRESYHREITRLPLTMRPALNKQLRQWDDLFPFERSRLTGFLRGVESMTPSQLDRLTQPLRFLEARMDLARLGFSEDDDTMQNASLLARSPYYAQWRKEVQHVFAVIEDAAHSADTRTRDKERLIFIVLPDTLPIRSLAAQRLWDSRGIEYKLDGAPQRVTELALAGASGLPALLAEESEAGTDNTRADCWMIDADARLGAVVGGQSPIPVTLLEYAALKEFRDRVLAQVNTVPKDIAATDQTLTAIRRQNWDAWWPPSLAGQNRLRSFVLELFLSGNGALIFSNAFVQWAASEALRRARPRMITARFGLRIRPKPFTSIAIFENQQKVSTLRDEDDPEGSAIDAQILARYIWLSTLRYSEKERTCCVCVAESSRSVYVIAPESQRPRWSADQAVPPEAIHEWMRSTLSE